MPISISAIRSSAPPPMPISAPHLRDHYPHRSASLAWISARAPVAGGGTCTIRAQAPASAAGLLHRAREPPRARAPQGAGTAAGKSSAGRERCRGHGRPLAGAPSRLQRRKKKGLTSRTHLSVREEES